MQDDCTIIDATYSFQYSNNVIQERELSRLFWKKINKERGKNIALYIKYTWKVVQIPPLLHKTLKFSHF